MCSCAERKEVILLENGKEHKFHEDWVQFLRAKERTQARSYRAADTNKKPGHKARVFGRSHFMGARPAQTAFHTQLLTCA